MNFQNVQFEASYGLFQQIPPCEMPEFAFSGRSNVGKSSLINKLFNRKQLARVSAMPGKTTTINFFRVDNVRFADLPGYGYAKVSKKEKKRWSGLIGDYLASDRDIALVFQLIDMRHPPTKDDLLMIDYLVECEMPFAVVLTKWINYPSGNGQSGWHHFRRKFLMQIRLPFCQFLLKQGKELRKFAKSLKNWPAGKMRRHWA